ncbi:MAG TPA: STAS domain-containing protein [Rhodanobacteraceae bacterium]|nr:STAS domain-containing protein [Oleiagrimonas sp.]HET9819559.1 STAS domain-containing protein [Rhodanobacteraceae bacterium]
MASTRKRKSPPGCRVQLGAELVIGAAGELHAQLGEALPRSVPVVLDAAAVTRLDTAGLQLLQAFVQARDERAGEWCWENVGAVLREAAAELGMERMLRLPDATAAIN